MQAVAGVKVLGQAGDLLLDALLVVHGVGHSTGELERDRYHLALDHHRADELPDIVDPDQVVLQDIAGHPIIQLKNTHRLCQPNHFLVLDRRDHEVLDGLYLEEVVDLAIEGKVLSHRLILFRLLGW